MADGQSVVATIDDLLDEAERASEAGDAEGAREEIREARQLLKCLEQGSEARWT